mgnify:CR=1 FL=1
MIISEKEDQRFTNPQLKQTVEKDSELKALLVDYTGRKYAGELARAKVESGNEIEWDGGVTVEMMIELIGSEFPEFIMAIAEENFIRGYRQAFIDAEIGMELANAEQSE